MRPLRVTAVVLAGLGGAAAQEGERAYFEALSVKPLQ